MKLLLSIICLCFLSALPAFCADYYVSTAGSDQNPGTQAQPFATIQHAIDACPYTGESSTVHLDGSTWNESPVMIATNYLTGYPDPVPDRPHLTAIGDYNGPHGLGGQNTSIINGCFSLVAAAEGVNAAYVTLEDVKVKQIIATTNSLFVMGIGDIIINDCCIDGSVSHGISINPNAQGQTLIIIHQCSIINCAGDGIYTCDDGTLPFWGHNINYCDIHDNQGAGITLICYPQAGTYNGLINNNNIHSNGSYGISFTNVKSVFEYNTVVNNGGYGLYFILSQYNPDMGGGPFGSDGNNTISGNGTYDLYKTGIQNIYVKNNHWDAATEAQMASGYQKRTNITRFYDAFDYWQPGDPLSGAFIWKPDFPKNGLMDFAASRNTRVQVSSLGQLKAVYAR